MKTILISLTITCLALTTYAIGTPVEMNENLHAESNIDKEDGGILVIYQELTQALVDNGTSEMVRVLIFIPGQSPVVDEVMNASAANTYYANNYPSGTYNMTVLDENDDLMRFISDLFSE